MTQIKLTKENKQSMNDTTDENGVPYHQKIPKLILVGYEQKGYKDEDDDILDEDVVRPENHKWVDKNEDENRYKEKSTMRCPTYGTCEECWRSGPTGKACMDCGQRSHYMMTQYRGTIIDSQTLAEYLGKGHEVAKANRTHRYLRTPMQRIGDDRIKIAIQMNHRDMVDGDAKTKCLQEEYGKFLDFYKDIQNTGW